MQELDNKYWEGAILEANAAAFGAYNDIRVTLMAPTTCHRGFRILLASISLIDAHFSCQIPVVSSLMNEKVKREVSIFMLISMAMFAMECKSIEKT